MNVYYFPKTDKGQGERARMKAALAKLGQEMAEYDDGVFRGDESCCGVTYPKQGARTGDLASRLEAVVQRLESGD